MTVDVIWGGRRYVCSPAPEPEPEPRPESRVVGYCQRDTRWAGIHLGPSRYTVGGSGCAMLSATMVGTLVDPMLDPLRMVTWLNANGGFVPSGSYAGNLYWGKAAEAVPGLRFVRYVKWERVGADLDMLRAALAKHAQVVQVDFKPETTPLDTHFVCALGFTVDGRDLEMIDPWTGKRGELLDVYSKAGAGWDLARAVYALAEYDVGA